MCHGHASTVVIMKVIEINEILGGYNPLIWDNNTNGCYRETRDSFVFSLKNNNILNSIISRVKNTQYAILNVKKK